MRFLPLFSALLVGTSSLFAADGLKSLRTEYREEPVGLETPTPRFSWQMDSNRKGAAQTAYELLLQLPDGSTVWDSGRIDSDKSVAVPYSGPSLKENTRYSWSVKVWNEKGRILQSGTAHFTTGLMDSGWSGAEWIGSHQPHFSKYRSAYEMAFDFKGRECTMMLNYRDEASWVKLEISDGTIRVSHCHNGQISEDGNAPLEELENGSNHIDLYVLGEAYRRGGDLRVSINGKTIFEKLLVGKDKSASPADGWYRFHNISIARGSEISSLVIKDSYRNATLYRNDGSIKGDGSIWSPADVSGAPLLRKDILLSGKPESALLYTTARGICNWYINGQRISDGWFTPGHSDYRFSIAYAATDVTANLHEGSNGIGALLGSGWWTDAIGFTTAWQDQYGIELSTMAKLVVRYEDGREEVFVTDGSWKACDDGPITSDSFLNGENYDARREIPGWSCAGFDDREWKNVKRFDAPDEKILVKPYLGEKIECQQIIQAVSVKSPAKGVFVYDMGQNMVGVPSLSFSGKTGQEIRLTYGEMLWPEQLPEEPVAPMTIEDYRKNRGLVYNENYRSALSTDRYICKNDEEVTFCPELTVHGYRYIQVEGLEQALPLTAVKGLVLNSIGNATSNFNTSDRNINKLFSNIIWGEMGNFLSVPSDCPQRDERLGWLGDAQIFSRTATYNMNVDQFFNRWIEAVHEGQCKDGAYPDFAPNLTLTLENSYHLSKSMGWMDAGVIIPWQVWQQYGDLGIVEKCWDSMVSYFNYLESISENDLLPGGGYGDWLSFETTSTKLTNTAWYACDALLLSKMASALGKNNEAAFFQQRYEAVKKAFNKEFVDKTGKTVVGSNDFRNDRVADGVNASIRGADTQTSYVLPMMYGLLDGNTRNMAARHLVEDIERNGYKLTTGFIGTPYLNLVLSECGYDDVAWKLFEQTECPSWLYPVLQGATTIWERWNSYTIKNGFGPVSMNSFNHYSYGAIEEWIMQYVLGIQRDENNPGYKHFILNPRPGGSLEFAEGGFETPYGYVKSSWKRKGNRYEYSFTIPANTSATLILPGRTMELGAGSYKF